MADPRAELLRSGYATVARAYREHLLDELSYKPLDRAFLIAFSDYCHAGPASAKKLLDVGCGPGHVAAFMHADASPAIEVEGIDLSPEMIAEARTTFPNVAFRVGDMFALPYGVGEVRGIVAFYAIVHTPTDELGGVAQEFFRVLAPGGFVALAFHQAAVTAPPAGERVHVDELFGEKTSLDFVMHDPVRVVAAFEAAGFVLLAKLDRAPYPQEHPTQRTYLILRSSLEN